MLFSPSVAHRLHHSSTTTLHNSSACFSLPLSLLVYSETCLRLLGVIFHYRTPAKVLTVHGEGPEKRE